MAPQRLARLALGHWMTHRLCFAGMRQAKKRLTIKEEQGRQRMRLLFYELPWHAP